MHIWKKLLGQMPNDPKWVWTKEWVCTRCQTVVWDCKKSQAPSCDEVIVKSVMDS